MVYLMCPSIAYTVAVAYIGQPILQLQKTAG